CSLVLCFFFFRAAPPPQLFLLSLHDALPISTSVVLQQQVLHGSSPSSSRGLSWLLVSLGRSQRPILDTRHDNFADTLSPTRHGRSEEHTSELQSLTNLVCRLLLEKQNDMHSR